MVAMVTDPLLAEQLIAKRRETGADRYDEVWEDVYVMSPLANNEHQELVGQLTTVLEISVGWDGLGKVLPGANITDRRDDWTQNYRCPDVVVFLNDTQAENLNTHWYGGPDFAIEIISPHDRAREKREFYAKVGTRELLLVDRDPWALELYRLNEGQLVQVGQSTPEDSSLITSEVVPLSWKLIPGDLRPQIEIAHTDGKQQWVI